MVGRIYMNRGYNHPHIYMRTYKNNNVSYSDDLENNNISLYSESFTADFKLSNESVEIENLKGKVVLRVPAEVKLVARAIRDLEIEENKY